MRLRGIALAVQVNELERLVIEEFLAGVELEIESRALPLERIPVVDREFTGQGFLSEFQSSPVLRLFSDKTSLRWGDLGVLLNTEEILVGFLVYVDDGYLSAIEGFTYGDPWPREINRIKILRPDAEGNLPSR